MPIECKVCGCKIYGSRDICQICYDEGSNIPVVKTTPKVTLERAMKVIDDYLNAGYKEQRAAVHQKAKQLYKDYYGIDYVNYNER
jgi:hypothetical protein